MRCCPSQPSTVRSSPSRSGEGRRWPAPFFVENEDNYLRLLNDEGRALLELVEASADRTLTATELAATVRRADAAEDAPRRVGRSPIPRFGPEPFEYLRLALDDPQQAAAQLIRHPAALPDNEQWHPPLFDSILLHCRQPGEHVRGCWVVDLLLGKK